MSELTLGVDDVRSWDTGALDELAQGLSDRGDSLDELRSQVEEIGKFDGWTGAGGDEARASASQISTDLIGRSAAVAALSQLVSELSGTVKALKTSLEEEIEKAEGDEFKVADNGAVTDVKPDVEGEDGADREAKRSSLESAIRAILRLADDADEDAARILDTVSDGGIPGLDGARTPEQAADIARQWADEQFSAPPPPSDVTQQQDYWDGLPKSMRDQILKEDPDLIVNAYGLDPRVRDKAAKNYLPMLRRDLEERRKRTPLASRRFPKRDLHPERKEIDAKLADLDAIESDIVTSNAKGGLTILGLRENDDGVGVVTARGDITKADNIAIHTPGMTTNARDKLDGELGQSARLLDEMNRVSRIEGKPTESSAVVTYMNMDFPPDLIGASSGDAANKGAPDLANLMNGTEHLADDGAHIGASGHSYGSVITSEALQEGGHADSVTFYGSPGIESGDDDHDFSVSDLHVGAGDAYAMQTYNDPIGAAPVFGPSPTKIDGITNLELNPEYLDDPILYKDRGLAEGHSGYHQQMDNGEETAALTNIAAVATGNGESLEGYDTEARSETAVEYRKRNIGMGGYNSGVDRYVK